LKENTLRGTSSVCQRVLIAALCVIACGRASFAQGVDGRWDAAVLANGVAVPFRFEVVTSGANATGFFFDGSRKVGSTSGQFERGRLTVEYDFLNTVLDAAFDGRELRGTYRNRRQGARPMEFVATRYVLPPAPSSTSTGATRVPQVGGEWVMYRTAPDNSQLDGMGFAPFGRVVSGMNVVDALYSGYGEGAPRGSGPDQQRVQSQGNAYLTHDFAKLDYIKKASIAK